MSIRKIGEPIQGVHIWTAAYGQEGGEDRIYAVSSGEPCVLFVIDPHTAECLGRYLLEGAKHCWGVVAVDSGVYIGGDGNLYRYTPEQGAVNLGNAIPGEHYTWRLAADSQGRVYGGCYPGGKVYQYDPAVGGFRDYGQIVEGEQYTRCMKALNDKLYIGVGTKKPHLIELDTQTGVTREITLPAKWQEEQLVYDLDIAYPKLLIRITPSNVLLSYDLETGEWGDEVEGVSGLSVSPPSEEGLVYFVKDDVLHSYDPQTSALAPTSLAMPQPASDYGWLEWKSPEFPGKSLVSVNRDGSYWIYHPATDRYITMRPELTGRPITLQSLTCGPDGRICIGGYFAGGFASYDPAADKLASFQGIGQIENMLAFDGKLYMGVYPKAILFCYDPEEPWDYGVNPKPLFSLQGDEQDRPFAFAAAGEELAIGTVSSYGRLGGALTLYRPQEDRHEVYRNIIDKQSIISLAYHDGTIFAGGTVWGGLGVVPEKSEAVLLMWDTATRTKVWEGVPVPGEKAISALAFDRDGFLWGLTAGTLFRFDPERKEVLETVPLFPFDWKEVPHYWRGGYLQYHSDHSLYGTTLGRLFQYELSSGKLNILDDEAFLFAGDQNGNLYFARNTELYQYLRQA
ncbi:Streptogramin lyase [Chlamydia abortus]|nr:Streptogramin lyase [Chlamydia abortus]